MELTDTAFTQLATEAAALVGLSIGYGKAFGPHQTKITQAVIEGFEIARRYRLLTNFAVGTLIAVSFTCMAAARMGEWGVAPFGILAGILASVTASDKHDAEKSVTAGSQAPAQTVLKGI